MNCEELIAYLSDYIDQNLGEELRREAQEHLATCQNCHVILDSTQKMIYLCRQNGKQGIPARRRSDLFKRLQRAMNSQDE